MRHQQALVRAFALLALGLAAACSSIDPYEKNRELLVSAQKSLAGDDAAAAAKAAERLVAGRAEDAGQFRLQRYFALYLAAGAHVRAATREAFLGTGPGAAASTIGSTRNADVPHLVAATYYAALARDLAAGAQQDPPVVAGTRLLPPELEQLGVENAEQKLQLVRLIALTRLGFATTVQNELENTPALLAPESCDEVLARVGLEKELVPWLDYSIFRFLESKDDRNAYVFGAKARIAAAGVKGSLPNERQDEIVAWVRRKSEQEKLDFCCQMCRKPFPFDKLRCLDDSTPITTFFPLKREN